MKNSIKYSTLLFTLFIICCSPKKSSKTQNHIEPSNIVHIKTDTIVHRLDSIYKNDGTTVITKEISINKKTYFKNGDSINQTFNQSVTTEKIKHTWVGNKKQISKK